LGVALGSMLWWSGGKPVEVPRSLLELGMLAASESLVGFALAFVGFLGMLACAVVIEGKLRAMSKAGYKDVVEVLRTASLNSKAKMRSKFDRNI
ncbi:MAG: hypothetical protein RIT23_1463, partial [Actinomycetota bacterium]